MSREARPEPGAECPLAGLPGGERVAQGLMDFQAGRPTAAAWLVAAATGRLCEAGLLPPGLPVWPEPELSLYRLLQQGGGDAYSRYNAMRRELDSFFAALPRLPVKA